MSFDTRAVLAAALLALTLAGCDRGITGPTPVVTVLPPVLAPPPASPAFLVEKVILSGVVFETTPTGRVPIAGVDVANGEGSWATTDVNGFYSMGPVWVCPCAAQPWVDAGTTFLWVTKDGYEDPPGTPPSVFRHGAPSLGTRDVRIDGNTRFDIELVRRRSALISGEQP